MQIFLDLDNLKNDKLRFNKQILELAQIISTSIKLYNTHLDKKSLYKPCYINHPIVKWSFSYKNLVFCIDYFFSLNYIREVFFKKKMHKSCRNLLFLKKNTSKFLILSTKDIEIYFYFIKSKVPVFINFKNPIIKKMFTEFKINNLDEIYTYNVFALCFHKQILFEKNSILTINQ